MSVETKYELRCNGDVVGYYDTLDQVKAAITATVKGTGSWDFAWSKGEISYQAYRCGAFAGVFDNLAAAEWQAVATVPDLVGEAGTYSANVASLVTADSSQTQGGN